MLLAVLSASMLRPVELSRMVSRSPSSVTGPCSGAGIPPVWTNTRTWSGHHRHRQNKKKQHNLVHTYQTVCMCVQTHCSNKYTLESNTPRYTGEWWDLTINGHMPPAAINKRSPTHTIWSKEKKTVSVSCLWQCKSVPYGLETTHKLSNDCLCNIVTLKIHKQDSQRL